MQMKPISATIPGYRIHEYLVVLPLPEDLRTRIQRLRTEFNEKFEVLGGVGGRPHLVLANFVKYEMMEERVLSRLQTVAMGHSALKIELRDFGSFPSHSIFINVVSKAPVQALVKSLRQDAQRLMRLNDDYKPHFILEPYLSLAHRLKPWQYEKAWLEYSRKNFTGRFIADALLVLKRPVGETRYQIAKRLEFMNLPVLTKQGELFGVNGQ